MSDLRRPASSWVSLRSKPVGEPQLLSIFAPVVPLTREYSTVTTSLSVTVSPVPALTILVSKADALSGFLAISTVGAVLASPPLSLTPPRTLPAADELDVEPEDPLDESLPQPDRVTASAAARAGTAR